MIVQIPYERTYDEKPTARRLQPLVTRGLSTVPHAPGTRPARTAAPARSAKDHVAKDPLGPRVEPRGRDYTFYVFGPYTLQYPNTV